MDGNWTREGDENRETIFGTGGLVLYDGQTEKKKEGECEGKDASGIPVNVYLWRATLDTLAFMPIVLADPFGGAIATDWYVPAESMNERFKINAYILDRTLRSDGIRVSVFRQIRSADGAWKDVDADKSVAPSLEDAILTRARQMRVDSLEPER